MYLNNIFADPEKVQRLLDIALTSLWPLLEGALYYTLPLTFLSFFFGIILAVLTALARISTSKPLQIIARIYVSAIRGTPLLVQLFILFFGLPTVGIVIDPFPAAVFGFSLNVGAYASEVIRAAIQSIPKGQWEAAHTIGMNYTQTLRRIILPQATRVSIPPLSNTFISLVKDTSLASLILVTEMLEGLKKLLLQTMSFYYFILKRRLSIGLFVLSFP